MSSRFRNEAARIARQGFTLLEVLIAMAFLAVISFAIYRTTNEAFRLREILMNEGEFHNEIRLSMTILGRDVQLLYSPTMMLPPKQTGTSPGPDGTPQNPTEAQTQNELRELEELAATGQDRPSRHWGGMISKLGIRPSRFVGTEDSITLVSASHIRIYKGTREGDLARIRYELKSDPNDPERSARQLVKTENSNAFDMEERLGADEAEFSRTIPLLGGIKSFKFQYYDNEKETWHNGWDTESADFKNRYPDVVRVQLEVTGPARLAFEGTYDFRPEIPLNAIPPSF